MRLKLYVLHGSHPCAAVQKALELKGLDYEVVEWPPPLHAPLQRAIFGARTVPGLKLDQEKVSGSRAIMRRLERLAPHPPLFPSDPAQLAAVREAERWGDEVLQPVARALIWPAMTHSPAAMVSYSEGSRIPLPATAIRASAPVIARVGLWLNHTNDQVAARELQRLPDHLDRVDGLISAGTIGDPESPNAADLQIFSTLRLLLTISDVRASIERRPSAEPARRLFPVAPGEMPAGSLIAA